MPSPVTAEFEKYVNYNVSLYNGVPDISIPLYTIHLKGLDVPISLSYHASGIKYLQESGEVGIGWVLNPGSRVSRTVYGQADERYSMPAIDENIANNYSEGLPRDKYLSKFLAGIDAHAPLADDVTDKLDGEYDIFNYILPTESGSFVITDRINKITRTLGGENSVISYAIGRKNVSDPYPRFMNFDVKDDKGNNYSFGQHSASDQNVFESSGSDAFLPTAWALTNITTAVGDQLNFKYSAASVSGWATSSRTFRLTQANRCIYDNEDHWDYSNDYGDGTGYTTFLTDEISNNNEKVKITHNSRNLITSIEILDDKGRLIKEIDFAYSNGSGNSHIFLDYIVIKDKAKANVGTYRFTYYNKDYSAGNLFADQWGYYKIGSAENASFHSEFKDDIAYQGMQNLDHVGTVLADVANRSEGDGDPSVFSLASIEYPTGGKTNYLYESNKFLNGSGQLVNGGGMRISRITSINADKETLIRNYTYGENGSGVGIPQVYLNESFFEDEGVSFIHRLNGLMLAKRTITYSSYMQGDIGATGFTHSALTYPEVTEHFSTWDKTDGNGKIVYKFQGGLQYDGGPLPRFTTDMCAMDFQYAGPFVVKGYKYWDKPLQKEIDYYSGNQIVKKETFEYATDFDILTGLKVKPFATVDSYAESDAQYYDYITSFFKYNTYSITCGKNKLIRKTETTFDGSNGVAVEASFQYNKKFQLASSVITQSNGKKKLSYFTYPGDYISGSGFIDNMVSSNVVAAPVEIVTAIQDIAGKTNILSAVLNRYKTDKPSLLESVSQMELNKPMLLADFKFSNAIKGQLPTVGQPAIFSPDSRYVLQQSYNRYDALGNILSATSNGNVKSGYIWDYNNRYLVARVDNAFNEEIAYTSFEADGSGNWVLNGTLLDGASVTGTKYFNGTASVTLPKGNYMVSLWSQQTAVAPSVNNTGGTFITTKNGWNLYNWTLSNISIISVNGAAIDELRAYPRGALMSTSTYIPLIGIDSKCDAAGSASYFEYDNFGRLKIVRDQDKNIIKRICYAYTGKITGCQEVVKYFNAEVSQSFTKNDCTAGMPPSSVLYTVPAGTYSSTIDQADADRQAAGDIAANGQQYANTHGVCTFLSAARHEALSKSDCVNSMQPRPAFIWYDIPAGKYSSTVSQADADQQATNELNTTGQALANNSGICVYYNKEASKFFTKSCPAGYKADPMAYGVLAGKYYSTISQADADRQANEEIDANGQAQADANSKCVLASLAVSYHNDNLLFGYHVKFQEFNGSAVYDFQIPYGSGTFPAIPSGWYDIYFYNTTGDTSEHLYEMSCGFSAVGADGYIPAILIDQDCSGISIY
ncbi:hypothetical protein DXN05_23285 [Deminuibacter soli]|uniref:DUF5977 domain-containing protein n=2 Tax=Deminuibacter soli TaxID=2291815 RepID=A0A3E1NDC1_9BACT|nr:hypothetical protein DXN05_23285 [Deminuibacter soli]